MTHDASYRSTPPRERLRSIGETADILGISVPTLRLYEREGLVLPHRRQSRHRRFSDSDIERVRCIREMIRKQRVSIGGIKHLLSLIPCWKMKSCPEDVRCSCPAFVQQSEPCWTVSGKSWECRDAECRSCPVYTGFTGCAALKNTIALYTLSVPPAGAAAAGPGDGVAAGGPAR
jgi:MerR family transcriptional regulator/heat shock protein HspR